MPFARTLDLKYRRESRRQREAFDRVRRTERQYTIQLRKIAKQIGHFVNAFDWENDPLTAEREVTRILTEYSATIRPWAKAVAASMLVDVNRRDEKAWRQITETMGEAMHLELKQAPTGLVYHNKMEEQVRLITSLPLDAAERVHKLVTEALYTGERAKEIADDIMRSGQVSQSRADLIARTEVGRAAAAFTQARAEHIESPGYIWQTAKDSAVRESHRKMQGKFVPWDKKPVLDGMTGHAGEFPNCRCYTQPIIPRRLKP